jgi:hypothetical protein
VAQHPLRDPLDLIRLVDEVGGARVVVRVLGRTAPGVLPSHDHLDVEFVIESGFLVGQVKDVVTRSDLSQWSEGLDQLAQGRPFAWRDDWRSVALHITPEPQSGGVTVSVTDYLSSDVEVRIPMELPQTWVDEQRRLLDEVELRIPSDVVEEPSLVYRWRTGPPPSSSP